MTDQPLRLRASLLSQFDVDWLGAVEDEDELDRLLLEDCQRIAGPDGVRRWTMDDAARRSVVASAGPQQLHAALSSLTHRPTDPQQRAIETLVATGGEPELQNLGVDELVAFASVSRWLDAAFKADTEATIGRRLQLAELTQSLHNVASEQFLGRDAELFSLATRMYGAGPITFVTGFGGFGKSALLARYLLGAAETHGALFAYLNFDDVALDPRYSSSLVAEIARQLAMQLDPPNVSGAQRVTARARDRLRTGSRAAEVSSRGTQVRTGDVDDLLQSLATLVAPGRPLILALDTLEEVQRRDISASYALARFLTDARTWIPSAQLILAGRAPVPELAEATPPLDIQEIPLEGLSKQDAIRLLGLLYDRGDVDLMDVVSHVGTSPLCVRLAAGVLRHAPSDEALRGLELHRAGLEGELYRRLLGHIPDPDVRRLAHPGLTLRRVTPDLIENVLAEPCEVPLPAPYRAHELFQGLAREAMLVERNTTDGALVHRPDVRRTMLSRLAADEPEVVGEIHQRAVSYYESRDDLTSRTEELYHRLMLGQSDSILDRRWDDRVVPSLAASLDELPPAGRAYVAARYPKLGVSDEDLRAAELETRRTLVQQHVQELIGEQLFTEAANVLEMHIRETGDDAFAIVDLRIQVLELLARLPEAHDLTAQARLDAARRGATEDFVSFTLHDSRIGERLGDVDAAEQGLTEALGAVNAFTPTQKHKLLELRLICAVLGLRRRAGRPSEPELSSRAVALYDDLGLRAVRDVPGLLRDLAAEVGSEAPHILRAALRTVGVAPDQASRVHQLVEEDEREESEPFEDTPDDVERGEAGLAVSELLEAADEEASSGISEAVADIYQAESDTASEFPPEESGDAET